MTDAEEIEYLGEIISSDGKNTKNVKTKISKGMGLVSEIIDILDNLKIGHLYFETAVLLRNSILINGMINSVEIWYNLTQNEVNEFEIVDRMLLQHVPGKIP